MIQSFPSLQESSEIWFRFCLYNFGTKCLSKVNLRHWIYKHISFPVIKIQTTETSFGLFCPPDIINFRLKSLSVINCSTDLTNLICPFDAVGETHTHSILFWLEKNSDQLQVTPPLINYFLARNFANENHSSETSRPLTTSSLAQPLRNLKNSCFAA